MSGARRLKTSWIAGLGIGLALAVVLVGMERVRRSGPEAPTELRVGFIAPPAERFPGARRGAELGAEEAIRAGELIGRAFALEVTEAADARAAVSAAIRMREQGAVAIVGGFDEPSCRALAELAEREGFVFLNVGCRAEELRRTRLRNTFHVEASDSMYRSVPGGTDPAWMGSGTAGRLWHPELFRYGAAQLNERFERRFGTAPDPAAWASWMAVKVLAEASLRARRVAAADLVAFLESDDARFDGHKGEPLRFDRTSHQLIQPLYGPDSYAPRRTGGGSPSGAVSEPEADGSGATLPSDVDRTRLAFISNEGSGDVTVVDTRSMRVIATVAVGSRPRGIRVSPDRARVYVALSDDAPAMESDRDAVAAVDLDALGVSARYPVGTDPEQFAVSPDGAMLYASNEDAGTATITDLRSGALRATLIVGVEPEGVAVSPDGRWVYITAETSNTVSVIDTRTEEVVASFLVDVRPRAAAFAPDGRRAYVTNEISGTISVIDASAHRVIGTIELEDERAKPVGVAVSADGSRVFVANGHAHSVSVIDAATLRVVANVPVGRRPWGVALTPDGRHLYTANGGSDDVSVIDVESLRVIGTIPVGYRPWGIAMTR